jgi:hypothetical protein
MTRTVLLLGCAALLAAACSGTPAASTPTASAAPAAACTHPYFPLALGAHWTYSDGRRWTVTALSGDADQATVSVLLTISNDSRQHTSQWKCGNGQIMGGVLATLYGLSPAPGGGLIPGGQTLVSTSGQFLPEARRLQPNFAWTQTFSEQLQISSGGTTASTIEKYAVTGTEPVVFNGREYEALRLAGQRTVDEAQDSNGQVAHVVVSDVAFELVLARGVGLISLTLREAGSGQTGALNLTEYALRP